MCEYGTPWRGVLLRKVWSSSRSCHHGPATQPRSGDMWRTGADETSGLSLWRPGFARSCLRLDHHHPRDGGSALLRRSRPGAKPPYPLRQGVCHLRRRLRRLGGTLRLRRLDPTGPCRRGTVLRSVVDRVQLVDRQPVYLPHPHGKVQRPTEIAAIRPAGRYHRRPRFPGCFYCSGTGHS